jgi:hypothetical protein
VLAKEKLLRGALRSVSRGMDDSFSCLYQLALAYFRGQVNAAGQRSATGTAHSVARGEPVRDAAPWQYRVGQGSARTLSGVGLSPCAAALL